jgi:hypothetical protein
MVDFLAITIKCFNCGPFGLGMDKGINRGPKHRRNRRNRPRWLGGLRQIRISNARDSRIVERYSWFAFIRYHHARFIVMPIGLPLSILRL